MKRLLQILLVTSMVFALVGCVIGPTPHPVQDEAAGPPGAAQDLSTPDPAAPTGEQENDGAAGLDDSSEVGGGMDASTTGDSLMDDAGEPDDSGPVDDSGPADDSGPVDDAGPSR